jgi:hypothetical protein
MIMEEPHGLCHISEVLDWIFNNSDKKDLIVCHFKINAYLCGVHQS